MSNFTDNRFSEKSAKVVGVDPSGAARQLIADVVKGAGFQEFQGLGSVKDVIEQLEAGPIDWIITPLDADQPENGLYLLKLCTVIPQLRNVRISLILDEEEQVHLNRAFGLGMMSWFKKPFTKDTIEEEMKKFLETFESVDWSPPMVAGHYIREFLAEKTKFAELLDFEKSLVKFFPGHTGSLLHLASAQFQAEKKDDGKRTLKQVLLLDKEREAEVTELKNSFLGESESLEPADGEEGGMDILGVKSVVVVDSDNAIQNSLQELFSETGTEKVDVFDDGESAANHIKENPEPDLIIQEWRLNKLAGPLFLQRVITEGAATTPIIVLSSLLKKEDEPLVQEMGVANLQQKPFNKNKFLEELIWTIQQDRAPTDQNTLERKIRNLLRAKQPAEAKPFVKQYLEAPDIPEGRKKLISAELLYNEGSYEQAKDDAIQSIKLVGDSIHTLNLLGKVLMQLRDFESALKCMEKAQKLSPLNIERLCQIAEAHTELGNEEAAQEAMGGAKDIDPDSQTVKDADVKIAMTKGDTDAAKELMKQLDNLSDIIGYMNNKAVAMARCGQIDGSIDQYRKTIRSLPDDRGDLKAQVHYNLALAYARSGELEESQIYAKKTIKDAEGNLKKKAQSLEKRLKKALDTGSDFKLFLDKGKGTGPEAGGGDAATSGDAGGSDGKEASGSDSGSESGEFIVTGIVDELMPQQGDLACYLIYNFEELNDPSSEKLLETKVKFKARKAIKREETLKGDSMLAKGA